MSHTDSQNQLSPYLSHYHKIRNLLTTRPHHVQKAHDYLIQTHSSIPPKKRPARVPQIVHLDTPQGVARAASAIASGWPIVTDYATTFGTAFPLEIRQEVAIARQESAPLPTVSLVATYEHAIQWLDSNQLHPSIKDSVIQGGLRVLESISFVRFPARSQAREIIGQHGVDSAGEIQVFFVPPQEPLMKRLRDKYNIHYIAVRSSNITGQPEETTTQGAMSYATQIGAAVLSLNHKNKFSSEHQRKRIGSQPIVRLPTINDPPQITLVRAGNTHPNAMKVLLTGLLVQAEFLHQEEKQGPPRVEYNPLDEGTPPDPHSIREALLSASGLY